MDDENEEIVSEETDKEDVSITPLEVKVVNQEKKVSSVYDDKEDLEYENLYPTEEQIAEFEDGEKN